MDTVMPDHHPSHFQHVQPGFMHGTQGPLNHLLPCGPGSTAASILHGRDRDQHDAFWRHQQDANTSQEQSDAYGMDNASRYHRHMGHMNRGPAEREAAARAVLPPPFMFEGAQHGASADEQLRRYLSN